jgi:hypothetical protein
MQRRSNWTPVIVSNRADRTDGETKVSEVGGAIPGPAFSTLNDSLRVTYLDSVDGWSEDAPKVLDRKIRIQADLHFTICVAIALTLPVLIGIGLYIATTALLRAS